MRPIHTLTRGLSASILLDICETRARTPPHSIPIPARILESKPHSTNLNHCDPMFYHPIASAMIPSLDMLAISPGATSGKYLSLTREQILEMRSTARGSPRASARTEP